MNERQRLERLMTLRERRQRKAELALVEQQRHCQTEAERISTLDAQLSDQQHDFDRQEQALFDAMQGSSWSALKLEQVRQAIDDHYQRQAELSEARQAADHEYHHQLAERDQRASRWAHQVRARKALEMLLERRRRIDRLAEEGRAELDLEDETPRGGR
ncbi:hypothetical protein [Litchfieldella rifensis]|uniref:Type III secretion protein n=1 Tax=Litchfieldella rifensis TaxID=762643 RepID=A0ABV7LJ70_9GAMM